MKNFNSLLLLFVLTLLFAGCEKDKDKEPTKEQLISAQKWELTAAKLTTNFGEVDAYALIPTCQKDNFLSFNISGKVIIDESTNKCSAFPQTQEGNWSINGDIITIDGAILTSLGLPSTSARNFTINELTNETLRLTLNEPITITAPGIPIPVTATSTTLTFEPQ